MKFLDSSSPLTLAALSLSGAIFAGSAFYYPDSWSKGLPVGVEIAIFLLILAGGIVLWLKASSNLSDGVQNERWPEEKIGPLRKFALSGWAFTILLTWFVVYCSLIFTNRHTVLHAFGQSLFLPGMAFSRIMASFKQKTQDKPARIDWSGMKPIDSQHWGER